MVKWLLEDSVFDENIETLKTAICSQGMKFKIHRYVPFEGTQQFIDLFDKNDCVVLYGSIQFAQQVKRVAPWVPGVYCDTPKYECLYYYPRFGKWLLNHDYVMLPFGELHRRKDFLLSTVGENGCVFVRPSSGLKMFTGKVIAGETWDKEIDLFALYEPSPESLVVVARPINLKREWRLVVVDNKVVTASQYRDGRNSTRTSNVPQEMLDFSNKVLNEIDYRPDPVWVLDICETNQGELCVLEVGCFSCAGLYNCDINVVVQAVSKVAQNEWEEFCSEN